MRHSKWLAAVVLGCTIIGSSTLAATRAANVSTGSLAGFAEALIEQHPDVRAARAELKAARSRRDAAAQPLYNPELELEAEDTAEGSNFGIGASQAIDWSDKREVRARAAAQGIAVAEARLASSEQRLASEALSALVAYRSAEALAALARRRVDLLKRFAKLADERQRAGDIGRPDHDLANLAYAEALSTLAEAELAANQALQDLRMVVGDAAAPLPDLPGRLPPPVEAVDVAQLAEQHPRVQALRLEAAAARADVKVSESLQRPDPVLGASVKREDDENVVGLRLSIPLYVRNDYSAETSAAAAEATAVEARMHAEYRRARGRLRTALDSYRDSRRAFEGWETAASGHLDEGQELLERLWRVGELSAPEFLLQLRQRLDARAAGLRLRAQVWSTWTQWLAARGDWRTEFSRLQP